MSWEAGCSLLRVSSDPSLPPIRAEAGERGKKKKHQTDEIAGPSLTWWRKSCWSLKVPHLLIFCIEKTRSAAALGTGNEFE